MEHENPKCQTSLCLIVCLPPCGEDFAQTKRATKKTDLCALNKVIKHSALALTQVAQNTVTFIVSYNITSTKCCSTLDVADKPCRINNSINLLE